MRVSIGQYDIIVCPECAALVLKTGVPAHVQWHEDNHPKPVQPCMCMNLLA